MISKLIKKLTSREVVLYLVFGVLTTLVDYVVFWLCGKLLGDSMAMVQLANVISWVCAVLFAFVTNRTFVFQSQEKTAAGIFGELVRFTGARLTSLLISMLIIYIGVDLFHLSPMIAKIFSSVVVVILNYIFSKLLVFRSKGGDQDA